MNFLALVDKDKIETILESLHKMNINFIHKKSILGMTIVGCCDEGCLNEIKKIKGVISIEEEKKYFLK